MRPDANDFLLAITVTGVDRHDDDVGKQESHEPERRALSDLPLRSNACHLLHPTRHCVFPLHSF